MEINFREFIERISAEYDQLNGLEKKINQFFFNFKNNLDNQPAAQLNMYLNNMCTQFKAEKEKLVQKQTQLDALLPQKINNQPDPIARDRRKELYLKLDYLDGKMARITKITINAFKQELAEHFRSTIEFIGKWQADSTSVVAGWIETISSMPVHKQFELFEWMEPMFGQVQKTTLHYETLLDELHCEPTHTSHKHRQRTGLSNLRANLKIFSDLAFASKIPNSNSPNIQAPNKNLNFSHFGVHTLQSQQHKLTPLESASEMHQQLTKLVAATNFSDIPSFYGLIRNNPIKPLRIVQTFLVDNTNREQLYCLKRDVIKASHANNFNADAMKHLQKHPIRSGMIDNVSAWLYYGGSWSSVNRAIEYGIPLAPSRFGSSAILLDNVVSVNEYIPCMNCNRGDILTDSICICDKTEEYVPILLCCAMLGNIFMSNRANNDGEEFEQAKKYFDSLLVEEITFGGHARRRTFAFFNNELIYVKYLLICKREAQ